jgi:hypothetical protein
MKQKFPIYFISKVLTGYKRYYFGMEKICYAIVMSARKLCHYFEAHTIKVLTNQQLNDIFDNRDSSGRISKWAMDLSEYVANFEKTSAIKSHIMADFVWNGRSPTLGVRTSYLSRHGSCIVMELGVVMEPAQLQY